MELYRDSKAPVASLEKNELSEEPGNWVAKDTDESGVENKGGLLREGSVGDVVSPGCALRAMAFSGCSLQAVVSLGYLSMLVARTPTRGCETSHRGTDGC